jgi:N-acetylneuraminic acid mutarotase
MKLTLLFLCFAFQLLSQSWVQLPDFPGTERDDGTAFVINNKAYCLGGLDLGFQCTRNGFVFDGSSETWSAMASLPVGKERQYAAAFAHAGYGYVFGGINCSNVCLNDLWKYDPVADSWTALPNFPGAARQGMCSFSIKNKAYIAGGKLADGTILNDLWAYDPASGTWTQKNNLPINGMWRGAGFAIDTIAYIGYGMINSQSYNHFFYAYDYLADTWSKINGIALPARRYVGTALCNQGAGLYGGQDSIGNISNELMVFDPLDNSVTWRPGIPTFGRKGTMAFSMNAIFYITTGVTNTARLKETWKAVGFVGVEEKYAAEQMMVYPNPSKEALMISVSGFEEAAAVTEVYNSLGQSVLSVPFSETLDVSMLQSGIYLLLVKHPMQVFRTHFVKD